MAWVVALLGFSLRFLPREARAAGLVQKTDLDAPLLCFALASLLSVFLSLDIAASVIESRCLGLMAICFLFAWQVRTVARRKILVRILIASSCVSALYGWVQFLTGWDLLGHYRPESGKVCGTFGLHLTYGEYLAMVICTGAGILLQREGTRLARWVGALPLGLMASAVLLSGSKGSLLGLAAGLGVVFAMRGARTFALYVTAGVLSLLALDMLMSHRFLGALGALFQVEAGQRFGPAASNAHRLCMWWTGLWISLDHFVHGVGLHALGKIYPAFRHPLAIEPNQWHLHNNFVHLGVTRGILGLAAFLYIFLRAYRLGFRLHAERRQGFDRGLAAGVLGSVTAFLTAGLTEYAWGDSEVLMLLYMLLGLLASYGGTKATGAEQEALPARLPIEGGTVSKGLGRMSRTLPFVFLAAGLCSLAFLLPPGGRTLRLALYEAGLGTLLLLAAIAGGRRGRDVPVRHRQACGGLAVCAGYRFTEAMWSGSQWVGAAEGYGWVGLIGFLGLSLLWLLLFRGYRNEGGPARLEDLAGLGALWAWSAIALVTYGLLRMAGWTEPLLGPPYLPLLLLTAFCAALYTAFRFAYSGSRPERILLAVLGVCSVCQVLR
jgi:O-antigen ligase